MKNKKQRF